MAVINLPTPGQAPWNLNPSLTAMNAQVEEIQDFIDSGSFVNADTQALNILAPEFGVQRGTTASQTTKVMDALRAYPGAAFRFPAGDYRFDTTLLIDKQNTLILEDGARLYAGANMTDFIVYDTDAPTYEYAEGKGIIGRGVIDAALKAQRALVINQVLHFSLGQGLMIKDAINRFLYTGPIGAEIVTQNLRLWNTGTTNVADNVGIEANMGDCHFRDVFMRDVTVAVKDYKANLWESIHPWIGPNTTANGNQMTLRYPSSIAFDLTGPSTLRGVISDTYRTAFKFRSNGTSYTERPNLLDCRVTWADSTLPDALALANQGYVFDNTDEVGAFVERTRVSGKPAAPSNLLLGPNTRLDIRATKNQGYVRGYAGTTGDPMEYKNGVMQGNIAFTPTIIGSNSAGTHTYGTRSGRLVVNGDIATYYIRVQATLDTTTGFSGSLRIGGIPLPPGATHVRDGVGSIGLSANVQSSSAVIYAGTAPFIAILVQLGTTGATEVDIPGQSLRGKTIDLMVTISTTTYRV